MTEALDATQIQIYDGQGRLAHTIDQAKYSQIVEAMNQASQATQGSKALHGGVSQEIARQFEVDLNLLILIRRQEKNRQQARLKV